MLPINEIEVLEEGIKTLSIKVSERCSVETERIKNERNKAIEDARKVLDDAKKAHDDAVREAGRKYNEELDKLSCSIDDDEECLRKRVDGLYVGKSNILLDIKANLISRLDAIKQSRQDTIKQASRCSALSSASESSSVSDISEHTSEESPIVLHDSSENHPSQESSNDSTRNNERKSWANIAGSGGEFDISPQVTTHTRYPQHDYIDIKNKKIIIMGIPGGKVLDDAYITSMFSDKNMFKSVGRYYVVNFSDDDDTLIKNDGVTCIDVLFEDAKYIAPTFRDYRDNYFPESDHIMLPLSRDMFIPYRTPMHLMAYTWIVITRNSYSLRPQVVVTKKHVENLKEFMKGYKIDSKPILYGFRAKSDLGPKVALILFKAGTHIQVSMIWKEMYRAFVEIFPEFRLSVTGQVY